MNVLVSSFRFEHLNTYVMCLWPLYMFYSFSVGIDDTKDGPRTERVNQYTTDIVFMEP